MYLPTTNNAYIGVVPVYLPKACPLYPAVSLLPPLSSHRAVSLCAPEQYWKSIHDNWLFWNVCMYVCMYGSLTWHCRVARRRILEIIHWAPHCWADRVESHLLWLHTYIHVLLVDIYKHLQLIKIIIILINFYCVFIHWVQYIVCANLTQVVGPGYPEWALTWSCIASEICLCELILFAPSSHKSLFVTHYITHIHFSRIIPREIQEVLYT